MEHPTNPSILICESGQGDDISHMEDLTRLLPPDVLGEVLRRLETPRRLAACRCVCKAWRDVVDACCLVRADLLPLSLAGIFTCISATELPKYFSSVSSANVAPFDYLDTKNIENLIILQHCNGLLLLGDDEEARLLNPTTRQWTCLPPPPPMFTPGTKGADLDISACTTDHNREENGAETDGTKWCHIYFHIFMRKQKRIQKHQKQI
jgi:hypothetical protein